MYWRRKYLTPQALNEKFLISNFVTWIAAMVSIQGDVQFVSQLKYKIHAFEKFIFMTSILNAVAQFHYYLVKVISINCIFLWLLFHPLHAEDMRKTNSNT